MILGIDPGPERTAWALYGGDIPFCDGDIESNEDMLKRLALTNAKNKVAIEMIASYGMPVGAEVFETCVWIGRFIQALGREPIRIYRKDVKMHLCGSMKAKDSNIRQALIDKFGDKGTKKNPGLLYGFKADMFSALAVAVTAAETKGLQIFTKTDASPRKE